MDKNLVKGIISSVERNECLVLVGDVEYRTVLKGSLRNNGVNVAIGDYVMLNPDSNGISFIYEVLERKSFIRRADQSGHALGYVKNIMAQDMVANIDYLFICDSLNQNFNANRIARYTVLAHSGNVKPVVILTKCDLCDDIDYYESQVEMLTYDVDIIPISSLKNIGLDRVKEYFHPGASIALLGSSGVGKSTFVNRVMGKEVMETSGIRESDDRGRHTTTHRRLFNVGDGITLIDTPGLRELGITDNELAIEDTFSDIAELECMCKFSDCRHGNEPGCAVKKALEEGFLSIERWNLYMSFKKESKIMRMLKVQRARAR